MGSYNTVGGQAALWWASPIAKEIREQHPEGVQQKNTQNSQLAINYPPSTYSSDTAHQPHKAHA
jgi:hypothetical protein